MALTAAAATVVPALPAAADTTITVTTTADGGPGSLRAAITTANASGQPVTIVLAAAATYDLTACGAAPEDANASGDLDLTATQPVTITGNGATIHQTCTDRRVLDHHGPGALVLEHATVRGGSAAGPGGDGVDGLGIRSGATLTITDGTVTDATAPATGGQAVQLTGTGSVVLDGVQVRDNQAAGLVDTSTGGTLTIQSSGVHDDHGIPTDTGPSTLEASGVTVTGRDITVVDTAVSANRGPSQVLPPPGSLPPTDPDANAPVGGIAVNGHRLDATNITVRDNVGRAVGGVYGDDARLANATVSGNWGLLGGGVRGTFAITGSTVADNNANAGGGFFGAGTIDRSTISGNRAVGSMDLGSPFGGTGGGGLVEGDVTIDQSTFADNFSDNGGSGVAVTGAIRASSVHIHSSTLAGDSGQFNNQMADKGGRELRVAGGAHTATAEVDRSVLGDPTLDSFVCGPGPTSTTSGGYNVVADASCFTSPQTTDVTNAPTDLRPLASNGSATRTRLPKPQSLVRDRIPAGDPSCTGTDQREVARPQGPACDSGATEGYVSWYVPYTPFRVLDTRTGLNIPQQPLVGGASVTIGPPPPDGASAMVLNVTVDRPTAESFLSVSPGPSPAITSASNLNFHAGQTIANLVTVPLDSPDIPYIGLYNNSGATDVIADFVGYFIEGPVQWAAGFTATSPVRILDTRPGTTVGGPDVGFGPGETRTVQARGVGDIPSDATAVAVTLTVTGPTTASHLTAGPTLAPLPGVSNLNFGTGDTIANLAIVPLGSDGAFQLRNNSGDVQVIADVAGWFSPTAGKGFRTMASTRILDTRPTSPIGGPGFPLVAGGVRTVDAPQVPTGATAVIANLTGVTPTATTHLTGWPTGQALPTASNLNLPAGSIRPVLATVAVDAQGRFDLRNNSGWIHALADLQGYYG